MCGCTHTHTHTHTHLNQYFVTYISCGAFLTLIQVCDTGAVTYDVIALFCLGKWSHDWSAGRTQ
jgi:hypothetical protein